MKKAGRSSNRKRPHLLPPLSIPKGRVNPMEPLKPPSTLLTLDGRLGSPIPRWQPQLEEHEISQENGSDNKPGIKITPCLEQTKPTKSHWGSELRNDPIYKEDADLFHNAQRKNSIKTLGLDPRNLNHISAVKSRTEKTLRLATPAVNQSQVEKAQERPKIGFSDQNFIPKKYAPLKPIVRKLSSENLN